MFKLVKIIGGRHNLPEITTVETAPYTEFNKGSLYYLSSYGLSTTRSELTDPAFISLESLPLSDKKQKIKGYYVLPEMVFETDVYDSTSQPIRVGQTLYAYMYAETGEVVGARDTSGSDLIVYSVEKYKSKNKIWVKVNPNPSASGYSAMSIAEDETL